MDGIVAAIESRNPTRLAELIALTTLPCEEARPIQPQPLRCAEGAPVGTPLTGVWVTEVEGGLWQISRAAMATQILRNAAERSWKLHSVYSFGKANRISEWMPETDFFITFAAWHPAVGARFDNLRIVDGSITALHFSFGEPGESWGKPNDPGWLLPRAN